MVSIEDIPIETRWEISTKSASTIPLLYDMHFRKVLGEKYDEIERPILIEMGKGFKDLAMALGLPSETAKEIAETIGVVAPINWGPEFKFEIVEGSRDRAVERVTGCTVLNRAKEMGLDPKIVCLTACKVCSKSGVENLNPKYTQRFNSSMCNGDKYCESIIERKR